MRWQRVIPVLISFLLPTFGQDPAAALERARSVNLQRAAQIGSFAADEVANRYRSRRASPSKWELFDKIEAEIVGRDSGFERQNVRRNGKLWKKPDLSDFDWGMPFGGLKALFSPKCPNTINFEKAEEVQGRQLLAYRYTSLPDGCFGAFTTDEKDYNPARAGRFVIDQPEGNLLRFEGSATEFPKGFGLEPSKYTIWWDYVKIGDTSYVLPVAAEVYGGFTKGDLWHVVVEYKNHRHFETSTRVTFADEKAR